MKPHTVRCGACTAESCDAPGVLGAVIRLNGRLHWHGYHPRSARALANFPARLRREPDAEPPRAQHYWVILDETAPATLPVWCRRHGAGTVKTTEVSACRDSIAVNLAPR